METNVPKSRRRARIALGLSLVAAVVGFTYLALQGEPVNGALLGALLVGAGIWEYRRKLTELRGALQAEQDANDARNRRRK